MALELLKNAGGQDTCFISIELHVDIDYNYSPVKNDYISNQNS